MDLSVSVSDQLDRQERNGAPEMGELPEEKFYRFCEDIREQPNWRPQADKACDYYDGNQLDRDTLRALEEKGMGPLISNLIRPTIDLVLGMEAKTRTDWRMGADDDKYQDVAEAGSVKLHEAERETRADRACSDAYASQVKAGLGWCEVARNADPFRYQYRCGNPHRREMYWDWRAREIDLQDGRYLIRRRWYDIDEAIAYFPGKAQLIKAAGNGWGPWFIDLELGNMGKTDLAQSFDQEQRHYIEDLEWRDIARHRVCFYETWYRAIRRGYVLRLPDSRVVELNLQNPAQAAAVARGVVRPIPAVYSKWGMAIFMGPHKLMDYGVRKRYNPYIPFWGYREDLTGVPYGLVRSMISPQDEVNARRQKMMWLLSAKRVIADSDALDTKLNTHDEVLAEVARPDAAVFLNPNRKNRDQYAFRVEGDFQLANQQFEVMLNAEQVIQKVAGVFNAMLGRDERSQSGLAINSLVEQGSMVLAEINDNFRYSRRLVGERLWDLCREDLMGQTVEVMVGEAPRKRTVILNQPMQDEATGMRYLANDTERAPVKVALEDVPTSPTYRQQLFVMMGETLKGLPPQAQAVLVPFWLEASDHPKRKDMARQLRVALGMEQPEGEEPITPARMQEEIVKAVEQALLAKGLTHKDAEIDLKKRELDQREKELDGKVREAEAKVRQADEKAEQARMQGDIKLIETVLKNSVESLRGDVAGMRESASKAREAGDGESKAVGRAVESVTKAVEGLAKRVEELAGEVSEVGDDRSDGIKDLGKQLDALRKEMGDLKGRAGDTPAAAPATIILDSTGKAIKVSEGAIAKAVEHVASAVEENRAATAALLEATRKPREPVTKTITVTGPGGREYVGTVKT